MRNPIHGSIALAVVLIAPTATPATFSFTTGSTDSQMAMASRPAGNTFIQIEAADDFILTSPVLMTEAVFEGLLPASPTIMQARLKIYRIFPLDSTNPPSG